MVINWKNNHDQFPYLLDNNLNLRALHLLVYGDRFDRDTLHASRNRGNLCMQVLIEAPLHASETMRDDAVFHALGFMKQPSINHGILFVLTCRWDIRSLPALLCTVGEFINRVVQCNHRIHISLSLFVYGRTTVSSYLFPHVFRRCRSS